PDVSLEVDECEASAEFQQVASAAGLVLVGIERRYHDGKKQGFYDIVNDPARHTIYIVTDSERAFDCVSFAVGSNQVLRPAPTASA
ncbi:MAG: hypothetical protein WA843_01245, partial [Candidatus Saccharimonadales bacterium]